MNKRYEAQPALGDRAVDALLRGMRRLPDRVAVHGGGQSLSARGSGDPESLHLLVEAGSVAECTSIIREDFAQQAEHLAWSGLPRSPVLLGCAGAPLRRRRVAR